MKYVWVLFTNDHGTCDYRPFCLSFHMEKLLAGEPLSYDEEKYMYYLLFPTYEEAYDHWRHTLEYDYKNEFILVEIKL